MHVTAWISRGNLGRHKFNVLSFTFRSPYQRLAQHMEDVSGDNGVLKEVVRSGTGSTVPADASVAVNYSAYLEYSDKPFGTNCSRNPRRLMKIGEDITLLGLEIALMSMKKREVARFLFRPDYAYGSMGCPPLIPPNATILFEVELLDFLDTAESDEFFKLSLVEREAFPLDKIIKAAGTEREFGNHLFRQKQYYDAKDRYKRACFILDQKYYSGTEKERVDSARLLVFLNLSLTYFKLDHPTRALVYGERALGIDERNPKALFRCGQACFALMEYEKARDYLIRAQREQPFNQDINNELKKLAGCYRDYSEKEKEMCSKMFASFFIKKT
ncbi:inactive peptidyl-prolyl cis-trans isomerase FKBP6 isoform X2 [Protopterus annectens]|uniref:inactive peptidyl-prolyl cis-trans isomerase FKBP6 isoform X2 n=1 Tax=Protopterus annectens TaxID=7888 RepID=UPI001CFA8ED6|nr:inactive peptidyl-prolyl cis-trans isomerase FKBP6 isoform X2 [Protopterus annectens]